MSLGPFVNALTGFYMVHMVILPFFLSFPYRLRSQVTPNNFGNLRKGILCQTLGSSRKEIFGTYMYMFCK